MPASKKKAVAEPEDLPPALYHEIHEAHRQQYYPDMPPEEFLRNVCNRISTLPEDKLPPVVHLPCQGFSKNGWQQAKYVIVLPSVSEREVVVGRLASESEEAGRLLRRLLFEVGIDLTEVVFTAAIRFAKQPGQTAYGSRHKAASAYLVQADIANCRPKVVITLGGDALKALYGAKQKLEVMHGSNQLFTHGNHTCTVVPAANHLQFLGGYGDMDIFRSQLRRAKEVADGVWRETKRYTDYRIIRSAAEFRALEQEIIASGTNILSYDTEFGNDVAREEYTYVLSAQLGWGTGKAAFIPLRAEFGNQLYEQEEYAEIVEILGRLLNNRQWRLAGHHLRVDIQRASELGIDADERLIDGIDTMLIHHLLYGDAEQGLDSLCRKYLPHYGAYWQKLEEWLDANSRKQRLRYGYRDIPWEILIPYAQIDADATYEIACMLLQELQAIPKLWALYWEISTWTSLHLLDVERQGVLVDESVRDELRELYQKEFDLILQEFRDSIGWQEFHPNKKDMVKALLYNKTEYKGKKDYLDKHPIPDGVKVFDFTPPFNTEKYPKEWTDLEQAGQNHLHRPSTKSKAIDLLQKANPDVYELKQLRQLSVLGKFLNTYLKPRVLNEWYVPESGKGFTENIWRDGRVRSHFAQTSETGRYRSYAVNLQTNPKKQEDVIFETFVDRRFGLSLSEYKYRCDAKKLEKDGKLDLLIPEEQRLHLKKFKCCYIAPPGHYLIEVDFKTAEIATWAYLTQDPQLIKIIEQGRDMHCEIATSSFKLPREDEMNAAIAALDAGDPKPYEEWVGWCKKVHGTMRTIAKALIFGIIYGRGAASLAREITSQGTPTTTEVCQQGIDGIAKKFATGWAWIQNNQRHAIEHGWVDNAFGYRRYFTGAKFLNSKEQAAIKREASNSPVQGCLCLHSAIYTAQGLVKFEDMPVNTCHTVMIDNRQVREGLVVDSGTKDTVLVVLANGASLRCTPDHLIQVHTPSGRSWKPAGELTSEDLVEYIRPPNPEQMIEIKTKTVYSPHNRQYTRETEAYLDERLGFLLGMTHGDGNVFRGKNSRNWKVVGLAETLPALEYIRDYTESLGYKPRLTVRDRAKESRQPLHRVEITSVAFLDFLEAAGVSSKTHAFIEVPVTIFNSPENVRLAYIDGYLTADGTVAPDGTLTWVTESEAFARSFSNLLATVGLHSGWFKDGAGYFRGHMSCFWATRYAAMRGFRFHKRKADWLQTRTVAKKSDRYAMAYPGWKSLELLPEKISYGQNQSACTLSKKIRSRGTKLDLATCLKYRDIGFKVEENLIPVKSVTPDGAAPVYDLSINTEEEDERKFIANGFTVHNCVAMLLAQSGKFLWQFRYKTQIGKNLGYKLLIPIHDAYLAECRHDAYPGTKAALTMCMSTKNTIPGTGGKYLGVDLDHFECWGDH